MLPPPPGPPTGPNRRQVLRATAALGATAASLTAASMVTTPAEALGPLAPGAAGSPDAVDRARRRVLLRSTGTRGLGAVTIALGPQDFRVHRGGALVSRPLPTSDFTMAALTWAGGSAPVRTAVRVHRPVGGWRDWDHMPSVEDGPDLADQAEGGLAIGAGGTAAQHATSLVWTGTADAVQVHLAGSVPADLRLHLVLSQPTLADRTAGRRVARPGRLGPSSYLGRSAALIPNAVPQPTVLSRAAWGANESWRSGSPRYNTTIKQVHVHHTATNNGYSDAEVPALIRGMYYYHTHTLGWSDIAYNFLVDIFGRIWEGRYGGIDQPVRGAHTLGFNAQSTGFSVIGNYQLVQPSSAVLASLSALAAWKLYPYGRDPLGSIMVTSEGSDKYASGAHPTLPVIDGHRDTNDTACPGNYVYAQLPTIRQMAKVGMGQGTIAITSPFTVTGATLVGQTLTVVPGAYTPTDAVPTYAWQRDGVSIPGATTTAYVVTPDDIGHTLSVVVTLARADYVTLNQPVATATPVMSAPLLKLRGVGHSDGRMRVKIKVEAPGVRAAGGTVVVVANLNGVKHRRTVKVGKGSAVARFVGLPPGIYYVSAAYSGTARVQGGRVHDHVKISRRSGRP